MDTPTPCANCLHFAPALEPGYCSHPSEATFPTSQQLDELATAGQPIPPCPGFTPTAPTPVRCKWLDGLTVPQGFPPALCPLLESLGFTAPHAETLAEWLVWDALPALLGHEVPLPGPCDKVKFQAPAFGHELGQSFLEWLSPPGLSPEGGKWIGEWDVEDLAPPIVQVDVIWKGSGKLVPIPNPWHPTIARDTLWATALAWYNAKLSPVLNH